jgi:hypothetical protein
MDNRKPTIIGWILALFLLYAWNKTRTGHTILFWGLSLICIFLLIRNYKRVIPLVSKEG